MDFEINLTTSAIADLDFLPKSDRQTIVEAITTFLAQDANVPTKRRKQLRPNDLSGWELRIGKHRVFYDFEDDCTIKIVAVGYKEHNEVFIRGKQVEL